MSDKQENVELIWNWVMSCMIELEKNIIFYFPDFY